MRFKVLLLILMTGILVSAFPCYVSAQQTEEQLGIQYYNNRELDKALQTFETLFKRNPSQFNYL